MTKLATGVQHGHDNFKRGFLFVGMNVHRNTASVIHHSDCTVLVDGYIDAIARSHQGFIDGVVDHFINKMMQSFQVGSTHVHTWSPANGFQTFKDLDIFSAITGKIIVQLSYLHFPGSCWLFASFEC